MPNIDTYLAKIREAVYGEEVRGSIHDAIQAINNEVVNSDQAHLRNSLATVYSTSASYAVGDYVFYPEDGVLYRCTADISGGEVWNSSHWIAVRLADDMAVLNNCLFNINTIDYSETTGYLSPTTGRVTGSDTAYKISDFISVGNILEIYVKTSATSSGVAAIAFYDFGKRFISAITLNTYEIRAFAKDIPENASYIRASTRNNANSWVTISEKIDLQCKELEQTLKSSESDYNVIFPYNSYLNHATGEEITTADWKSSEYILADNANSITVNSIRNTNVGYVCFYDINKTFISSIQPIANSEFTVKNTDFPSNATYFRVCISATDEHAYSYITVNKSNNDYKLSNGLKYMCFGDSITSDEVCGIGTTIGEILGTSLLGNFAHGNATCSDYHTGETNTTEETPYITPDLAYNANVLSNQIRNALAYATDVGEAVTFTHSVAGQITLNQEIWSGTGSSDNIPDVIYIAIGTNDGGDSTLIVDDSDIVNQQNYGDLTRCGFASSLRWAIETLVSKFPNAQIFVATPLHTAQSRMTGKRSYELMNTRASIIKKVCQFCSVNVIDSYTNSGVSAAMSKEVFGSDGLHPLGKWRMYIAKYVANNIKNNYIYR